MNRPSPDDMRDIYAMEYVDSIEKENNKLKKEIKNLRLIQETNEKQIQNDIKEREELRKENETLKLRLDNKDKLLEEYRKQINKLRTDNIYEE